MNIKLFVGTIIFILCCILAFLIPNAFKTDDCEDGVCKPLTERRINIMTWLADLAWYWWAAIIGAIAYAVWFFCK